MDTNLQKCIAFITTAECGSFTRAAEILQYSQSGISRMIADLEREWNVPLLERGKSGIRLTSDGLRLLPYARNVCAEFDKLRMQVDDLSGLKSGLIRVGAGGGVLTRWLPSIIKSFSADYPGIDYEIIPGDFGEIEQWLLQGRIDLGFLGLPAGADLDTVFLEQDRLLAVLPGGHPFGNYRTFPLVEFSEEPFILLEKGSRSDISDLFLRSDVRPDVRYRVGDEAAAFSMVKAGLGVTILPELSLPGDSGDVLIRPLDVPAYRNMGVALRSKKSASLAVKRFLDYLGNHG